MTAARTVNGDNPPDSVPVAPTSQDSQIVLPLTELGKKTPWTLTLHSGHLALADAPGAQPYVILRAEVMRSVVLMEGMRAFSVRHPRKIVFKLTPEGADTLAAWIGKPALGLFYLKRRFAWVGPLSILWVLASLLTLIPAPGGGMREDFDVLFLVLGATMLAAWLFAKWRPNSVLFLVDSIWFALLGVYWIFKVIEGQSPYWLLLAVLGLCMSVTGLRHFLRFRGTKLRG